MVDIFFEPVSVPLQYERRFFGFYRIIKDHSDSHVIFCCTSILLHICKIQAFCAQSIVATFYLFPIFALFRFLPYIPSLICRFTENLCPASGFVV